MAFPWFRADGLFLDGKVTMCSCPDEHTADAGRPCDKLPGNINASLAETTTKERSASLQISAGETKDSKDAATSHEEVPWEWATFSPLDERQALTTSQGRILIQSRFCDLFFPKGSSGFDEIFKHTDSSNLAITAACDALCALQLGTAQGDRSMLFEFRRLYGRALRRVRVEIERADKSKPLDSITATVYFLAICELFTSTTFSSPAWQRHALGLLSLYNQHESKRAKPGASSCCFLQWRYMFSLGYGLVAKRSVLYNPPTWSDERRGRYPLTAYVMQVPTLLEKLEFLRVARVRVSSVAGIVGEAIELRDTLRECILENSLSAAEVPYYTVSIDEYPLFKAMLGNLAGVYKTVYRFSDMTTAQLHRSYWTCLLVLDQAIADVRAIYWSDVAELNQDQLDATEEEIPDCADHLARALPWYCSPEVNTAGPISLLEPLHFLQLHFERHGTSRHFAWSRQVHEHMVLGNKVRRLLENG